MYYSQFGEDRILAEIFDISSPGTCVEVGANDGVFGSNSLFFEQAGWHCILVEPNPELCAKIRRERRAQVFECGAADCAGRATLLIAEGDDLSHGVSTVGSPDGPEAKIIESYGFTSKPIQIEMRTLDSILSDAAVAPGFEFMSIDVEGLELSVMKGFSLDRWRPRVVIIEDNAIGRDPAVREHMAGNDYLPFRRTGVNDWYARRDDTGLVNSNSREIYHRSIRRARRDNFISQSKEFVKRIPGSVALFHAIRGKRSK